MTWVSSWLVATISSAMVISAILLRQLAHPDVKFGALFVVFMSWTLSLTVIWVAPLDLNMGLNEPQLLSPVWRIAYWVTSVLTWLLIPLQQSYYDSGHFRAKDRINEAFRSNLQFYIIAGALVGIIGFMLVVVYKNNVVILLSLSMALANVWGLFLMVVLLGYGLVDIPRKLWNIGNLQKKTRALYFKAVEVHDEYQDAIEQMSDTLAMVAESANRVRQTDDPELNSFIDIIEAACPSSESVTTITEFTPSLLSIELRDNPPSEHLLAKLHYRVKKDYHENRRAEYEWNSLLDRLDHIESEEIEKLSRALLHQTIRTTFSLHVFARILSIVFWIMTAAVLWSEVTLFKPHFSLFSILIGYFDSPSTTYIIGLCLISYLAVCAFYSMFRIRLSTFYHLHFGRHSEANSLLFNASYILRLMFPLGINFFATTLVDQGANTSFEKAVGKMNVVPILGQNFNLFVPIVISVLCCATLFNLYGRILRLLQISQFEENGPGSDQIVEEGESLVRRYRRKRARLMINDRTMSGYHKLVQEKERV